MNIAVILAGGIGSRVGGDRPKQFIEIFGKPVLAYTIEIYQNNSQVDAIEIVCHKEWIEYTREMVNKYNYDKVKWIVEGGETFQTSVISGVYSLKEKIKEEDIVMLHYGASPFTNEKIIEDSIKICEKYGNAVSCTPCFQLMGTNDDNNTSQNFIDRDKIIQLACPQSFKYSLLLNIYETAKREKILSTTEPHTTSLMYALGIKIYQSYGNQTNIKITTKEDLKLFEGYQLLRNKSKKLEDSYD